MKVKIVLILFILFSLCFIGCSNDGVDKLNQEIKVLTEEKKDLEEKKESNDERQEMREAIASFNPFSNAEPERVEEFESENNEAEQREKFEEESLGSSRISLDDEEDSIPPFLRKIRGDK